MTFQANIFLIGAQKAGTTTLADLLNQHPLIHLSSPKEPNYYSQHFDKGAGWYRECFAGATDGSMLLDASVSYSTRPTDAAKWGQKYDPTYGRDIPALIAADQPNARFIYILRNPIERTYSAYLHRVRFQGETRSLRDAVGVVPGLLDTSRYSFQIERYFEHFGRDQFLFINFSDLALDPTAVARRCFEFLDAAPVDFQVHFDRPKNQAFEYNAFGGLIRKFLGSEKYMKRTANLVQKLTPRRAHYQIKQMISRDPDGISEDDRDFLVRALADEFAASKSTFGFDP